VTFCLVLGCRSSLDGADAADGLAGRWETVSALEPPTAGPDLLRLEFVPEAAGVRGRLSMPPKALYDLPLQELVVRARRLRFHVRFGQEEHAFRGTWTEDRIRGTLASVSTGGRTDLELAKRVQPPVPYQQEEVAFDGEAGLLAGTVTRPQPAEPDVPTRLYATTPAAVLVSPAGSHNRDAEIHGFPLFFALADLLTRQGVTVLRCDDRGVGRSTGSRDHGIPASAEDALRAARFLGAHEQTERVGLIGYCEGGLAAVHAAAPADAAFVVLLDAPVAGYPLTGELEEMPCPLLAVWSAWTESPEHMEAFLSILERSEHPDYTAKRFPTAEALFRSPAPPQGSELSARLDAAFRRFLLRWLEIRLRRKNE